MNIVGDYHTHTTFSHGKHSIEDNVRAAVAKGLKTIAITDHGYGHLGFGVKRLRFKVMREEIERLKSKFSDIEILLGVETNLISIDGDIDIDDEILPLFDFLICGYHFGSSLKHWLRDAPLHLNNVLKNVHPYFYAEAKKINTQALVGAMNKYTLFFISHPGAKGPIDVAAVAKVACARHVLLEINNSHGHLTVEDIRIAKRMNAQFIINSDAHERDVVGSFGHSIRRANEASLVDTDIFNAAVR